MDLTEARALLGVEASAEWATVRLRYKKLALKLHPDKNPGDTEAPAKFAQLRIAYDALEKAHLTGERVATDAATETEQREARAWHEERMRARAATVDALRQAEEAAKMAMFEQARKRARANSFPPKPAISEVDETSVTVTWQPPDEHLFGPVAVFELQWCLVRCPDGPQSAWAYVWQTAAAALPQRTARKKNLQPGHAYVFRVRAQNDQDEWSAFSEPSNPGEPGAPPEDVKNPATYRPHPLQVRVGQQPCQLVANRANLAANMGSPGAWQLQYRALRGLWTAAPPPPPAEGGGPEPSSLELSSEAHGLDGLHERAQYCLRARVQHVKSGLWSVWSEEAGPFGVRPGEGAKPRQTGYMRSVSKALLAAGLRSSSKVPGEEGDKLFADGSTFHGPLVSGLAHGMGELSLASGAKCTGYFELDVLHGGQGSMVEVDGASAYSGQWARGARHGQGTQTWATGPFESYAGGWEEGMFHGLGTLTMRSGETYAGGWEAGLRAGQGEARVPKTGEWYKGGWAKNRYAGKGQGRFIFQDQSCYEGETMDGGRQGDGLLVVPAEEKNGLSVPGWSYKGRFEDGEVSGKGELTFSDGRRHSGVFLQGRKHGKGRFVWPSGDYTDGAWENGAQVGDSSARVTYANGDVYEGGMRAGSQQGEGVYTRAGGHTFKGSWVSGSRHGHGKSTAPNGDWYDGSWERDEQKGKGRMRRAFPGGIYEGACDAGQPSGKGSFCWDDGRKYEGEWTHGTQHGYGTFADADGDKYVGYFEKGQFHGQGKQTLADGDYFHGEFSHGEKAGKAKARMTYASGDVYEGDVVSGVRNGYGTYLWQGSLDKFAGYWESDKMHGKGKLTKSTGSVQQGAWNHGDFTG